MADPTTALVAGAGFLWLLNKTMGGPRQVPPQDNRGGAQPDGLATTPQGPSATDTVIKVGGSLLGAGGAIVGAVTKIGTAVSAVGTATATGATAGTVATATSLAAGITTSVVVLSVFAAIVVLIVFNAIANAVAAYKQKADYAQATVAYNDYRAVAREFFSSITKEVTTWNTTAAQGSKATVSLSPSEIRTAAIACLYLAAELLRSRNDTLVRYYQLIGWTPEQMKASPIANGTAKADPNRPELFGGVNYLGNVVTISPNAVAEVVYQVGLSSDQYKAVTAPLDGTFAELQKAAVYALGEKYGPVVEQVRLLGQLSALFVASVQGISSFWPGDQQFTAGLANLVGWSITKGVYWATNSQPYSPYDAWWMVDPVTGTRFAPILSRDRLRMIVSTPGVGIAPQVFSGAYGAYGVTLPAGRHTIAPAPSQMMTAVPQALPPSGLSKLLLPAAVLGAGFLWLRRKRTSAAPAPALSGYRRRRRRG